MVVDLAAWAARAAETPQEEATPGPVPFAAAAAAARASGPAIHPRQETQAGSVAAADAAAFGQDRLREPDSPTLAGRSRAPAPQARMVAGTGQEREGQRMDPPAAYSTDAHLVLDSSAINLLEDIHPLDRERRCQRWPHPCRRSACTAGLWPARPGGAGVLPALRPYSPPAGETPAVQAAQRL